MKKKILAGLVVTAATIALLLQVWTNEKPPGANEPRPRQADPQALPPNSASSQPEGQLHDGELQPPEQLNFSTCESFTQLHDDRRLRWLRANHESWGRYIDEGFSLDVVTLTIEKFLNSNFAASFRIDYLRSQSELGYELQNAQVELERQFPEARDFGLTLMVMPPSPAYENFASLSYSERETLVASEAPSLDEVAYFMNSDELTDDDILLLLSKVDDVQREVHYHGEETLSILNYAISAGRLAVVRELLDRGLRPANDSYLGSSMEYALVRLSLVQMLEESGDLDCCPREAEAAEIVALMQQYGSAARFTAQSTELVEGQMPRRSYRFDRAALARLRQQYGLDLTAIPERHTPSMDNARPLIEKIDAELTNYLAANTDPQHLDQQVTQCRQLIRELYDAWQPTSAVSLMSPIVEQYPNDPDRVEQELAAIDPGLVDIFRKRQWFRRLVRARYPLDSDIEYALAKGDPQPAIVFIDELDLDSQDQEEFALHILSWDESYINALFSAGLLPARPEYFLMERENQLYDIDRLKRLENMGLDLRGEDSTGRTVLHYAVQNGNVSLVSQLVAEGFPVGRKGRHQDLLHLALDPTNYRLPIHSMEPIVRELMALQPDLDGFHYRRLAVMELKYPDTYQALVADFPQLEVPEGTELMPVSL